LVHNLEENRRHEGCTPDLEEEEPAEEEPTEEDEDTAAAAAQDSRPAAWFQRVVAASPTTTQDLGPSSPEIKSPEKPASVVPRQETLAALLPHQQKAALFLASDTIFEQMNSGSAVLTIATPPALRASPER